jgi:hypothetical protein
MEGGVPFSHKVDGLIVNAHCGEWEETELDTLVHHVHGSKPARLNIVLNFIGANTDLMHE